MLLALKGCGALPVHLLGVAFPPIQSFIHSINFYSLFVVMGVRYSGEDHTHGGQDKKI